MAVDEHRGTSLVGPILTSAVAVRKPEYLTLLPLLRRRFGFRAARRGVRRRGAVTVTAAGALALIGYAVSTGLPSLLPSCSPCSVRRSSWANMHVPEYSLCKAQSAAAAYFTAVPPQTRPKLFRGIGRILMLSSLIYPTSSRGRRYFLLLRRLICPDRGPG
jgi:hypothetical protein